MPYYPWFTCNAYGNTTPYVSQCSHEYNRVVKTTLHGLRADNKRARFTSIKVQTCFDRDV